MADLATHDLRLGYLRVIGSLAAPLVLLCLGGARAPGRGSVAAGGATGTGAAGWLPHVDGWYWARMLVAGTLGTAAGDFTAGGLGLGTGMGTLVLGGVLAGVLGLGARSRWAGLAAYSCGVVAVRSAGTTAGDFLVDGPGLGFGLPLGTGASGALLVVVLLLLPPPATGTVRGDGAAGRAEDRAPGKRRRRVQPGAGRRCGWTQVRAARDRGP